MNNIAERLKMSNDDAGQAKLEDFIKVQIKTKTKKHIFIFNQDT